MIFRHHNNLRLFTVVARHDSFSSASEELNLTKGAISHQIRQLEAELGFALFERLPRGISLTLNGRELLATANLAFEGLERKIGELQHTRSRVLTIGMTTYFASRWLSPRLMDFMHRHPDIRLRLQPMIRLTDLSKEGIDLAVRWGDGSWDDVFTELLFLCAAWPCGNADTLEQVNRVGLEQVLNSTTLLHDSESSTAWAEWFATAGLDYHGRADTLIIPDPNVRVQAVIDGQGVALNDALVEQELANGMLFRLGEAQLSKYGYYLELTQDAITDPAVGDFSAWLKSQA